MRHRTGIRLFLLAVLCATAVANAADARATSPYNPPAERAQTGELENQPPNVSASQGDRLEFISFQLAYGLIDGGILGTSTPFGVFPLLLEGAARGIGAGLWSMQPDFDSSQVMAIDAGTFWGHAWSVLLAYAIQGNGMPYPGLLGFIGGTAGTFIGGALALNFHPPPGALAMANSGAVWAAVLAVIIQSSWSHDDWRPTYGAIEVASIGGFVSGLLLSKLGVPPRESVLLVDLGGIVGLIFGAVLAGVIHADPARDPLLYTVALGGFTAGGLGLGAMLTRLFVPPPSAARIPAVSLAPVGRDGFGLALNSRF